MSDTNIWTDGLVDSLDMVRQNARRFWNGGLIPKTSHAWKTLSGFQHWYFIEDLDLFAPSKFIGYQGTTLRNYEGQGHGTYTCQRLEEWFEPVKRPSPEFSRLRAKLEEFLGDNGKRLSSKVVKTTGAIYVLKAKFRKPGSGNKGSSPAAATGKATSKPPSSSTPAGPPAPAALVDLSGKLDTISEAMVKVRRHQEKFRDNLLAAWNGRCPVTGCHNPDLLRASHIKPWADCNHRERLDTDNGLLLAAHLDAAFDRGLISFDDSGAVLISSLLSPQDQAVLGLRQDCSISLDEGHLTYLKFHREKVFRP